ncbi:MAG: cupin domain-containing protein [Pseudomonadota bacterium]|nr:cupin domain-containing protein [Pseudomonadota bacterium]MEE3099420.1 cupin domain-containing protein [Pseudomonadota bacterium]
MLYPDDQVLVDYASGAISPGLGLLVATHLTFSPASRRRVADLEVLGGLLIESEPEPNIPPPSLAAALDRLDAVTRFDLDEEGGAAPIPPAAADESAGLDPMEAPAPGVEPAGRRLFPAPLRAFAGGDADDMDWKFRLPGLSECELAEIEGEEISLIRARPGAPMLSHTHSGVETTLILSGEMEDRGRIYRRGDVSIATSDDDHRPKIVGDETCICLVVMTGELRFTGTVSRVLNFLT